jgi:hypothetical protein
MGRAMGFRRLITASCYSTFLHASGIADEMRGAVPRRAFILVHIGKRQINRRSGDNSARVISGI